MGSSRRFRCGLGVLDTGAGALGAWCTLCFVYVFVLLVIIYERDFQSVGPTLIAYFSHCTPYFDPVCGDACLPFAGVSRVDQGCGELGFVGFRLSFGLVENPLLLVKPFLLRKLSLGVPWLHENQQRFPSFESPARA